MYAPRKYNNDLFISFFLSEIKNYNNIASLGGTTIILH